MTDTKHTPGPWHEGSHRSVESPSGTICEVYSHMGIAEADANQKLIAAAPDLLDALVDAVRYAQGGDLLHPAALSRARAAIAKATGGAA
jgi:hypothetical protein